MKLEIASFAKINLNLFVLGKREDGYHEIASIFQTIDLHDSITLEESSRDKLTCSDDRIPTDETNIVSKSLKSFRDATGVLDPVTIHIEKRIPSPGGLGGGSSNAAVALIGLNRLFDTELSRDDLLKTGSQIGADVNFFFFGGTAICSGIGEKVKPLDDWREKSILLSSPNESVGTPWAYEALSKEGLTKDYHESILKHYRIGSEQLSSGDFRFENEFSDVVRETFPLVESAFQILGDGAGREVGLSGSGPSVFTIIEEKDFPRYDKELRRAGIDRNFLVKPVSAEDYRSRVLRLK